MTKISIRLLLACVTLSLLTACSGQVAAPAAPTSAPAAESTASTTGAAAPTAATTSGEPITVKHAGGTLTLPQPATRVVACSEEAIDFLTTLQVQPIGICSDRITGATSGQPYELPHFFPKELLGTPTFVGTAESPSLEQIVALKPDLIISGDWSTANEKMSQIAPTLIIDTDAPDYWRGTLVEAGKALGREAQAQQFLSDYDATAKRLAEQTAPIAAQDPNVLFLYSYAASDGTMVLGPTWPGAKPFELLGFKVLEPQGVDLSATFAPVSPEIVSQVKADIIFVIRVKAEDGTTPRYPIDDLLDSLKDTRVIYQEIPPTRGSTAPYTDRYVLEEIAGLLAGGSAADTSATTASFPRPIKHVKGELTLDKPATRVAALEWTYVEDLLALGVQPVAVADIEGYNDWVKIPVALDATAQDVGLRGEPNLEKLASLKPDLIIMTAFRADANYEALNKIAPVLVFEPYPNDPKLNQYDEMRETFLAIAAATGRDAEGKAALERMDATFAEIAKKIEAAGSKGAPFVLSQAWSGASAAEMRLFTETAMATQIVARLGLTPAWKDGFQPYGFSSVSVEALPKISEETHFFYVVQDNDNVFQTSAVKPLWDSLPFVKAGNAHPLGGDTWLFGGPLSAEVLAGIVYTSLTEK